MKRVWSPERGYRVLKAGADFEAYREKHPGARRACCRPSLHQLESWLDNGVAKALDGCTVEPDGYCEHGCPSWLLELGYI